MKKLLALMLMSCLTLTALGGCSSNKEQTADTSTQNTEASATTPDADAEEVEEEATSTGDNTMYLAATYTHPSLDVHNGYYGWFTTIYGISETLFKMDDSSNIQPWLAESGTSDGNTWTIVLKENVVFSNGDSLTADLAVRNLQRTGEENDRFSYMQEFQYEVVDDTTFTITTETPYPTMLNTLTSCETGMIHLDAITDFESGIIATGAFQVEEFIPSGDLTVVANENYWNGTVELDRAVVYRVADEDAQLMAMQNGEIDAYTSVSSAAAEIYAADPSKYTLVNVASPRVTFYILNQSNLPLEVCEALNLAVNTEEIVAFSGDAMSVTSGPFASSSAYGDATEKGYDPDQAKELLEENGYSLNGDGYYEKDGTVLEVNICYYVGRSLDVVATVMQDQLREIGIMAVITNHEHPDDYITASDFDIALMNVSADTSGDPEYFISTVLQEGSYYNVGGYENAESEALISELKYEMDSARRADLANQIVQLSIDHNAYGYIGLTNKITVLSPGTKGFAENSPYDFYGLDVTASVS